MEERGKEITKGGKKASKTPSRDDRGTGNNVAVVRRHEEDEEYKKIRDGPTLISPIFFSFVSSPPNLTPSSWI